MRRDRLDGARRNEAIQHLENEVLDVLVVGGGVTGVGAALDASARGLAVGLIEQGDLASGTSSRSSKLIHGGLRYLETLDFALVREALRERGLLLRNLAPHLVTSVPFLLPLRHRVWERAYVGAGVALYDRLGGARQLPRARHLSRRAVARAAPGLRSDAYIGGIQFWDAQTDDARYVVTLARTAAAHGAHIAPRVRALGTIASDGRVCGVRAMDSETGRLFEVRARHVIAAAGPWGDRLFRDRDGAGPTGSALRPSKGVHLLLPRDAVRGDAGLLARTRTGLLFVIPWEGAWLAGDTDTEWSGAPEDVRADQGDIAVLLERLESQLGTSIDARQILGVFAGVRPLVAAAPGSDTVKLSREHAITSPQPGLTSISGGKFTTYRVMAQQLVDTVAQDLGREVPASRSATIPLLGADGFTVMWQRRRQIAEDNALSVEHLERLLRRYGSRVDELLELLRREPDLAQPVAGTDRTLRAEVVHACTHEGARHVDDVLMRRTRISDLSSDRGAKAIDDVVDLMARTLGWSAGDAARERQTYLESVAAERGAVEALSSTSV